MGCPGPRLRRPGAGEATGGDEVFRDLVLARIIEPVSKLDSGRVPEEADIAPASYPTVCRRLRMYAWRAKLAGACAAYACGVPKRA